MNEKILTGKASIDKPWLKYFPPGMVENIIVPECTLRQYLKKNCPGEDVVAMHFYGDDIKWATVFQKVDATAKSLKALGFGEGSQIPVLLRTVPEFFYLLLAAEKIGASLLCRDNTLQENVEACRKAGAKVVITHDFLAQYELEAYLEAGVEKMVLIDPLTSGSYDAMPDYIQRAFDELYAEGKASGDAVLSWDNFMAMGEAYTGTVEAPEDINRPLFRAYTSGSTGPSKQVIHSANTIISVLHQMNFYGSIEGTRPTWMVTILPPSLVAVVVSMTLLPLASNKLLILNPFVDVNDVDLEMMRYRPNTWPMIPMFIEKVMRNGRVPADYDMSHLHSAGCGCEAYNNNQMKRAQQFLKDHNCNCTFTTGYGSSEGGSNITLPMSPYPIMNGNIGIPMPLSTIGIFKQGTQQELPYNEVGEICICSPGNMLGYDSPEATASTLQLHDDGNLWLHMGDTAYMTEDGVIYLFGRRKSPRITGGFLDLLPMENKLADAEIEGIDDEFFVIVPDITYPGFFVPYLYVVLKDGYTVDDIRGAVLNALEPHQRPVEIIEVPERPFFHFKTNRVELTQDIMEYELRKRMEVRAQRNKKDETTVERH